jgi:hypothetical protein
MSVPAGQLADGEAIRGLAAEILQRPEYAAARDPVEVLKYLRWFLEIIDWFDTLRTTSPGIYWLVLGVLLLVLVLLVAHISWAISRALRESVEAGEAMEPPPPVDFLLDSRRLAHRGHYLEAAHRLLLATLQHSARAGMIQLRPEDTNRKLRGCLDRAELPEGLRRELLALMVETERVWFRDRRDDPILYDRWSAAYAGLLEATK